MDFTMINSDKVTGIYFIIDNFIVGVLSAL